MRKEVKEVKEILKKQGLKASIKSYYKEVTYIFIDTLIKGEKALHIDIIFSEPIKIYDGEYTEKITLVHGENNYIDCNIFNKESIKKLIRLGF